MTSPLVILTVMENSRKGSNYKQLSTLNLFDTGSGKAADRGGDYEDPQLESFTTTVPDGTYKLIGE